MNITTMTKTAIFAVLACGFAAANANAAVITDRYKNDTEMTNLFLWAADPTNLSFGNIDLSDNKLAGWSVAINTGDYLVLEGPAIAKSQSKINIDFHFNVAPFSFQFAEVLYDSVGNDIAIRTTGLIGYKASNGKLGKSSANPLSAAQGADINAYFNPAPAVVPLPGSAVFMLSAISLVGVISRRDRRLVNAA